MSTAPEASDRTRPAAPQTDGAAVPEADAPEGGPAGGVPARPATRPREFGGPPGPEPTRYGDWQFNGRVTDF